jgi:hypothetical protein
MPRKIKKPMGAPRGNKNAAMHSHGRPTLKTPELVHELCLRIASGRSILSVASDLDMPEHSVIYRWRHEDLDYNDKNCPCTRGAQGSHADQGRAMQRQRGGHEALDAAQRGLSE